MGTGTNVAMKAGGITLLKGDLRGISLLKRRLSRGQRMDFSDIAAGEFDYGRETILGAEGFDEHTSGFAEVDRVEVDAIANWRWGSVQSFVIKRDELHMFAVLPKCWIVERSFGWLEKCRRLWKNRERKLNASLQLVHLAFLVLLLGRS
jgi:hypothetical protein